MNNFGRNLSTLLLVLIFLSACRFWSSEEAESTVTQIPTSTPIVLPTQTAISEEIRTPPAALPTAESYPIDVEPTATEKTQIEQPVAIDNPIFIAPASPKFSPINEPPSAAMLETAAQLQTNIPAPRDDIDLAKGYFGLSDADIKASLPIPNIDYQIGDIEPFSVNNFNINSYAVVNAELLGVSEHAYFWFDETAGNSRPDLAAVVQVGEEFDAIYKTVSSFFGTEKQPGIDGNLRVHILNASPLTLCRSSEAQTSIPPCGLLGYVSGLDGQPKAVNANSNQKEMFVMNGSFFGTSTYLSTLAHEYRHMIEANYDQNDIDWEVEGSAMLAEDLVGNNSGGISRGNVFLSDPDQQLNRWSDFGSGPRYGQGYLLNRFIYDRMGTDLYREFATSDLPGLSAVTAIADQAGLGFTGEDLWLDWLTAPVMQEMSEVPKLYAMPNGVIVPPLEPLDQGDRRDTTVNQFAADYYVFPDERDFTIEFNGDTLVPLLEVQPSSGDHMWTARRTNYSMARLSRTFDLTLAESATLEYDVYRDIEQGYDFAYVAVSADGGTTYQTLVTDGMDGLIYEDDPGNNAYAERFYTGQNGQWMRESADLTPWVGQEIEIRFEFVTDPILNFDGIAIDNIAIPEIGYVDDAETDMGWTADGWVRATGYIPQNWHVRLVYLNDDTVNVSDPWTINPDGSIEIQVVGGAEGRPILMVAASAPVTLNPASYRLTIR
ncbi:MAG: hypothetical protein AAF902_11750 [Chloroflexota bacterium]